MVAVVEGEEQEGMMRVDPRRVGIEGAAAHWVAATARPAAAASAVVATAAKAHTAH